MRFEYQRARERRFIDAEQAGESAWSPEFDTEARERIATVIEIQTDGARNAPGELYEAVNDWFAVLTGRRVGKSVSAWLSDAPSDDPLIPTVLEAVHEVVGKESLPSFVNNVFGEHRIAWRLEEGTMVSFRTRTNGSFL